MKFTWANIVTLLRLFLAPVFLVIVLMGNGEHLVMALFVFAIAALTDWFDGILARRYGEVTPHGAFLDPLADKVLTTSAFVALYMYDVVPLWMDQMVVDLVCIKKFAVLPPEKRGALVFGCDVVVAPAEKRFNVVHGPIRWFF